MTETNLVDVRASRAGDQFHYMWASRRCLLLLSPDARLRAITIEGASLSETTEGDRVTVAEELIDVAEYYGSEKLEDADTVRYIQVKHSTVRTDSVWVPSELKKTIKGFAKRYKELKLRQLEKKLEFWFVSNRRISTKFLRTVHDMANGVQTLHVKDLEKLELFTELNGEALASFCKLLHLEGNHEGLWDQRNLLFQDIGSYLAGDDVDSPLQLKELVTKKALPENAANPSITRMDVLRALKTDESRLFPAPCFIKKLENPVPREQESLLLHAIIHTNAVPIIIHAPGGVGKSIFATRIELGLPLGSSSVLFDCFGNGQYRSVSAYRHRHKDALVQIANELAAKGLCHPLIPTSHADPSDYMRAFLHRLNQSITSIKSKNPQALLCIIVDAADNAQIAAEEIGEAGSFVRDLIRERLAEGVRLVVLCRTHRQDSLNPPPSALRLELQPFSRVETATFLRHIFPNAKEQDIDEFHRLSSQNPRVQELALSRKCSLSEILRSFGPNPTTVEDMIENMLDSSIVKLRDEVGAIEKRQIDRVCTGLAALRPLIPLPVLASISGVDEAAINSFALDLGHPLRVADGKVQFLDEPTETWFRDRFKPTESELSEFVATLMPLAASNSYVASALPQLMLESKQFRELVELALSSQALPETNPVERRDIELQRLQFALRASLRDKRYVDAAKLALKAGGESAGDERQRKLLQANTDLGAVFLSDRIEELVSRKTFGSGWNGSHYAYEASLLSGRRELLGDARSRLRMAYEWLKNWAQLPKEEREGEEVQDSDILEMATASFNIHGADACADELRRWRPREISWRVGRTLARRFIDRGRYQELDKLSLAADNDLWLMLAITLELQEVHRTPSKTVVESAFHGVLNLKSKLEDNNHWDGEGNSIRAVTALVEAAYKLSVGTKDELIELLTAYLPISPPRGIVYPNSKQRVLFLRASALRAALNDQSLDLIDLAHEELRKKFEEQSLSSEQQEKRDFKESIGLLLPWYLLWARIFTGQVPFADLEEALIGTKGKNDEVEKNSYREQPEIYNEIACIWFDILLNIECVSPKMAEMFDHWIENLRQPLSIPTLTYLARLSARSISFKERALDFACKAFDQIQGTREHADWESDSYIGLARAVLMVSRSEAAEYFSKAVEVASKIGDENLDRWGALLDLADRAASPDRPSSMTAYNLARCAELTYIYVDRDKHFDWEATIEAITALCGKSSLAILSRWRDRGFGQMTRLLPVAVNFLVARGDLNPKVALSLTGFRAQWNEPLLLKGALEICENESEKEAEMEFIYRYMTLGPQNLEKWRKLKSTLDEYRLTIPRDLDERIALSERDEQFSKSREFSYEIECATNREEKEEFSWDTIFNGIDLSDPNDVVSAYRRFAAAKAPSPLERFFEEAFLRVTVGKEAEFISSIADITDLELYDLRIFLGKFPERWGKRYAIKSALAKTLKTFCRRFCMQFKRSRYFEMLPLRDACALAGISEIEMIDVVLSAIGEASEVAGTDRLFTLVGLLALKLTENEAMEALSFGLAQFDSLLEDTDGDGNWSSKLEPPVEIDGADAGYIWSCLAAPKASLRWEAAHVVCALCKLGGGKVLDHLIALANGASSVAFYDDHLFFYELHARQWLLIGLAHVAQEHPKVVVPYADFLTKCVFQGEPHVLIREFAKKVLLLLLDAGLLESQTDLRNQLASINKSPFPRFESSFSECFEINETDTGDHVASEGKRDRLYFGIDMGPYWFEPLGGCFGKSRAHIENEVVHVIRNTWQISCALWDEDQRQRRKIYTHNETHHSHGSYPRVDELRFYLAYHAMMVVAGKLLSTSPVHHNQDESQNEFHNWLMRHALSRQDGGWLADRRDPIPLERPAWKNEKETDDWRCSVMSKDFDRILIPSDNRMNLWGGWTCGSGYREESVHVYSALVSPESSMALLRALHSVDNYYDYQIPSVESDLQIDLDGFEFKGWIVDRHLNSGLDEQDPWSGSISYPPPAPAAYIIELMGLGSDFEQRRWFLQDNHLDIAWSQVWGTFHEKDDEKMDNESGVCFQASFVFIISLLRKLKMDLIVEVGIKRHLRFSFRERSNSDEIGCNFPNTKLFLVKSDGGISTL